MISAQAVNSIDIWYVIIMIVASALCSAHTGSTTYDEQKSLVFVLLDFVAFKQK